MRGKDNRRTADIGNVLKVAERLVSCFGIDDRNQRGRREIGDADGISVRRCGNDLLRAENTAGAGTIFHNKWLAEALG